MSPSAPRRTVSPSAPRRTGRRCRRRTDLTQNGEFKNGELPIDDIGNGVFGNGALGNGVFGNGVLGNAALRNAALGNAALGNALAARLAWQVPLALALIALAVHFAGARFELVGFLYLALVTPELCRVDLAAHRLPNALVLPGLAFAGVGIAFGWLAGGRPPIAAILAVVVVGGFFALLAFTGGLGMGDVKLAASLALAGGAVSVAAVVGTVVIGFIAAGVGAFAVLIARGGAGDIAFGPYLLGGFWASVAALPLVA